MQGKSFNRRNEDENILIKNFLRKMDSDNLSEKEKNVLNLLKKTADKEVNFALSKKEIDKAILRNKQKIYNGTLKRNGTNTRQLYIITSSIAVIALIIGLIFSFSNTGSGLEDGFLTDNSVQRTITTGNDIKKITLLDGSIVYLNTGTTLSLQKGKFNKYAREIWLEEGEVFFEIKKDTKRPFIVHSSNGLIIRVLGTSFNIKSYPELDENVISVNSGKVQVFDENSQNVVLEPNYKVSIDKSDGKFITKKTNSKSASDWITGHILFEDASIKEVAFRLKQLYDVELIYKGILKENERIYASFNSGFSLEEIVETICKLYNVTYNKEGSKIYLKNNSGNNNE